MRKLRLESLEERTLLAVTAGIEMPAAAPQPTSAVILVTTLSDVTDSTDGVVSLREAVAAASDGDTVLFDESLSEGTITLDGSQLEITKGIIVDASGVGGITVNADGKSSVFKISGGTAASPVTLVGLTITGGAAESFGGGVSVGSGCFASIADCVISSNRAGAYGGGLYNKGTAQLTGCILAENAAESNGGAINNVYGASLTLTECSMTGNSAQSSGGAINNSGTLTLSYCQLYNNVAVYYGGAINNAYGKTAEISESLLYGNEAGLYGGAIYNYGTLTLSNATITGNTAATWGGGIYDYGSSSTYNSIIAANSAGKSGGDIYASPSTSRYGYHVISSYTGWTYSENCIVYDSSVPLFTDPENSDYALSEDSQAVDVGNNDYVSAYTDLAGNKRIVNRIVDIGAYEYQRESEPEQLDAPQITAGRGVFVSYGANRHLVSWEAVENADSYELAHSGDGVNWNTLETEETSTVVTGLVYGADVAYRVRALGDGSSYTDSDWSAPAVFNVCPMDINNDADISGTDRSLLASAWLAEEGDDRYLPYCDITGDGDIGAADRAFLAANWLGEAGDEDLVYPPARSDAASAVFASADLDVDLGIF